MGFNAIFCLMSRFIAHFLALFANCA